MKINLLVIAISVSISMFLTNYFNDLQDPYSGKCFVVKNWKKEFNSLNHPTQRQLEEVYGNPRRAYMFQAVSFNEKSHVIFALIDNKITLLGQSVVDDKFEPSECL